MTRIPSQVKVARVATEWLRDELSTLTPEQWQTPNACGGWCVADVAAHLVWVADRYRGAIRRALADDVEPPRDVTAPANAPTPHAQLAEIAVAYRHELGDQVLDQFARANLQLVELFEKAWRQRIEIDQRPKSHRYGGCSPVTLTSVRSRLGHAAST